MVPTAAIANFRRRKTEGTTRAEAQRKEKIEENTRAKTQRKEAISSPTKAEEKAKAEVRVLRKFIAKQFNAQAKSKTASKMAEEHVNVLAKDWTEIRKYYPARKKKKKGEQEEEEKDGS